MEFIRENYNICWNRVNNNNWTTSHWLTWTFVAYVTTLIQVRLKLLLLKHQSNEKVHCLFSLIYSFIIKCSTRTAWEVVTASVRNENSFISVQFSCKVPRVAQFYTMQTNSNIYLYRTRLNRCHLHLTLPSIPN